MHASAVLRNKRAYHWHTHRLDHHKDAYWALDDALPALLADTDLRTRLSPYEYSMYVMDFRGDFSAELDIAASITHPPRDLHVLMRIMWHPEGLVELELSHPRSQALGRWQVMSGTFSNRGLTR